MNKYGFVRCTAVSPQLKVGNPVFNCEEIAKIIEAHADSDIIVFPEYAVTGYTIRDLNKQSLLMNQAENAVAEILVGQSRKTKAPLIIFGSPVRAANALFNSVVGLQNGHFLGAYPKQALCNYGEFEEERWNRHGREGLPEFINFAGYSIPFGTDILFAAMRTPPKNTWVLNERESAEVMWSVVVEICEDFFMPIPHSSEAAKAGAIICANPSASPEQIGKDKYVNNLVLTQSGRGVMGYIYASCGPCESSNDIVCGGRLAIAENGTMRETSRSVGDGEIHFTSQTITQDIDVEYLASERRGTSSFASQKPRKKFRLCPFKVTMEMNGLKRNIPGLVFVPSDKTDLKARCTEIQDLQAAGFIKKVTSVSPTKPLDVFLPLSGGMDSTCALLPVLRAYDHLGWSRKHIHCWTLPSFGTPPETTKNALKLMELTNVTSGERDIRSLCVLMWLEMEHDPFSEYGIHLRQIHENCKYDLRSTTDEFTTALEELPANAQDLTFENVQAMMRTQFMKNKGFLIGTGCLSEGLVGWCTFLADQQSMYNVNISIPKTLEKWLIRYYADHVCTDQTLRSVLHGISGQEISPHLLPTKDGKSGQSTEDILGPYELIDFLGFYGIKRGHCPSKVVFLAQHANWSGFKYDHNQFMKTARTFYPRFFNSQFKRNNAPEGPKVGTFSLSQRGDWRMPSDADPTIWIEDLEKANA